MAEAKKIPMVRVLWEEVGNRVYEPLKADVIGLSQAAVNNVLKRNAGRPDPLWMTIDGARKRGIETQEKEIVEEVVEEVEEIVEETVEEVEVKPKRRKPRAKKSVE